jgi:hypothetical protein
VRMALVSASVAIVIHGTAAEHKGRNGHGESDFHVGAFHRVAGDSLRAPLLGACKPLLATPSWMRMHVASLRGRRMDKEAPLPPSSRVSCGHLVQEIHTDRAYRTYMTNLCLLASRGLTRS